MSRMGCEKDALGYLFFSLKWCKIASLSTSSPERISRIFGATRARVPIMMVCGQPRLKVQDIAQTIIYDYQTL